MKTKSTLAFALIATALAAPAPAQQAGKMEEAIISIEPGRATAVRTVELAAQVVAIDKATRTVTLKGVEGIPVDVVAHELLRRPQGGRALQSHGAGQRGGALSRYELGPKGIRVHVISPRPLRTRAASGIGHFDQLLEDTAARAPACIDDVGFATAALAGDGARLITGETIYVDGGLHIVS